MTTRAAIERRKMVRTANPRFGIGLVQQESLVPTTSINVSSGGLCFRVRQALEVRSVVRMRLTPESSPNRQVDCKGRVAWVVQRQDLTEAPPFYYDIGIEFIDPSPTLRQFLAPSGERPVRVSRASAPPEATVRGRCYVPHIDHDPGHESPWHLIVLVEGAPCFSGRYQTKRAATMAWNKFRRQQARR